jgi:hypothetical protein
MAKFAHLFQSSVGSILTDFLCSGARQAHKQAAIPPKTAKNPANNHNQLSARHLTQWLKAEVEIGGQKAERIVCEEGGRLGGIPERGFHRVGLSGNKDFDGAAQPCQAGFEARKEKA